MRTTTKQPKTLSAEQTADAYKALAVELPTLSPAKAKRLLAMVAAGQSIGSDLRSHRNERRCWAFFRRVSRWVHGAEDKELDRWAGVE